MKYKTIICCAIILSNALCWGYVGRRVVGGPVVVNNNNQLTISIPDDVKDYTNRVQQCYYLQRSCISINAAAVRSLRLTLIAVFILTFLV